MRVLCVRTIFFSLREKKLFKKVRIHESSCRKKGTNTRAHIDMRALRVFHNNDEKKYKIERVKISQYLSRVCVCMCV